jgi:hypothetical protein
MSKDRLSAVEMFIRTGSYDGHRFDNHGLSGRRLGPGRHRFSLKKGKPDGSILYLMYRLLEPWAGESVRCVVPSCERHGPSCPLYDGDDGDCRPTMLLGEGPRWSIFVSPCATDEFILTTSCHPRVRTLAGSMKAKSVCRDAGFVVQAFVGMP